MRSVPVSSKRLSLLTFAIVAAAVIVRLACVPSASAERLVVYAISLSLGSLFFFGSRLHERYLLPGVAFARCSPSTAPFRHWPLRRSLPPPLRRARMSTLLTTAHGGGKETRTPDPHAASVMLYQLSYAPTARPQ